jgi:DNA helicase HerA-like ATPase
MKTKRASEIRKGDRVVALKPVPKKPSKAYVGKVTTVKVLTTQTVLTQHSYVYDLSVPKLENFIAGAGGVVCHNTRAGKSYLAGRFIEEIVLNTPFPVLVIDVHADYVKMDQKMGSKEKHGDFDVVVYYADEKAPKVEGVTAKVETLSISPAQMTDDQIAELLGKTLGERQVIDLDNILSELRSKKKPFGLDDMIEVIDEKLAEIQEDKEKGKKGSGEGRSRLESLKDRLQHLTGQVSLPSTGMDLGQFFKPKTLNILCLSGLRANIQDAYTSIILDLLFQHITSTKTKTGKVMPLFIFVEEAHRVASNRGTSKYSVGTISTIIREGAKFGMYLTLISQRPRSIDPDILSNVGNYAVLRINNPQDQEMIEKASENISHRLVSDLPGLNQGEAVLVGPFVPLPAHVMVLTRRTVHHGVTPNLKALMDEMDKKQKRAEKGKF